MNKNIGALLVLISKASLRPRVGWPMACHFSFSPWWSWLCSQRNVGNIRFFFTSWAFR